MEHLFITLFSFRYLLLNAVLQSVELGNEAVEFLRGIFGLYDSDNVRLVFA